MDLGLVTSGDWFYKGGQAYQYAGDLVNGSSVVLVDNRPATAIEADIVATSATYPLEGSFHSTIRINPSAQDVTLTSPEDRRTRTIINSGNGSFVLNLPDGSVARAGQTWQLNYRPDSDDYVSVRLENAGAQVVGAGAALPDATRYDAGAIFLLYGQADPLQDGWYEVTNTWWTHRSNAATA